jgi:hypothetical protein
MLRSFKWIVLILISVFVLNQVIELNGITIPILHEYLDDLLCLPIVLSAVLFIHRRFRLKCSHYVLPVSHVLLSVLLIASVFEVVLPNVSTRYTGDFIDVLAYMVGAFFFLKHINVPPVKIRNASKDDAGIHLGQTS